MADAGLTKLQRFFNFFMDSYFTQQPIPHSEIVAALGAMMRLCSIATNEQDTQVTRITGQAGGGSVPSRAEFQTRVMKIKELRDGINNYLACTH